MMKGTNLNTGGKHSWVRNWATRHDTGLSCLRLQSPCSIVQVRHLMRNPIYSTWMAQCMYVYV